MNEKYICQKAVKLWGHEKQINQAIQEKAELIKELTKIGQGRTNNAAITEEIVDVHIMMEQLKIIMREKMNSFDQLYKDTYNYKMLRLEQWLKN